MFPFFTDRRHLVTKVCRARDRGRFLAENVDGDGEDGGEDGKQCKEIGGTPGAQFGAE